MTLRFNQFREITAKHDGQGCLNHSTGPHAVSKGDRIGYAKPYRRAKATIVCVECWRTWAFENADAESMEQGFGPVAW